MRISDWSSDVCSSDLQFERQEFMKLMMGVQSAAQRHIFFAERKAAKIDGIADGIALRSIKRVGVIGAGTMGGGISMNFLSAGIPVTIVRSEEHTSELQSLMRISYAVFCLKKKKKKNHR